jgi:hypothetical protein
MVNTLDTLLIAANGTKGHEAVLAAVCGGRLTSSYAAVVAFVAHIVVEVLIMPTGK